ncbi:hypothetical protein K503DRAFT_803424 [Rhizopogon vinicolor AM-OR11-026]|uniref:Uncharacterized protein n=1 Tax=Rhizopogon vinicolor AM-OR11-026 TaxID=1314800 RepID=A0A1B7MPX9_9AGAM|nr:hypothetical protein K503DRAFT_803424 [Rhizopogon vinicolor AM-OR11-026]
MSTRASLGQPTEQEHHRDDDDGMVPRPKPIDALLFMVTTRILLPQRQVTTGMCLRQHPHLDAIPPSPLPDLTDEDIPMPAKPLPTTDETTPAPLKW